MDKSGGLRKVQSPNNIEGTDAGVGRTGWKVSGPMASLHGLAFHIATAGPGAALAAAVVLLAQLEPSIDPDGSLQEDLWPLPGEVPNLTREEALDLAVELVKSEKTHG